MSSASSTLPVSPVSPMSRQPSWRSSVKTPTSPSHYRGVQRGYFDTPATVEEENLKPRPLSTIFGLPRPPAAAESPKKPAYNYKPVSLRWWFLAVLVAILAALIAVTEHTLRSLPDYGLAYDMQRLATSMSKREFPHLSPRVKNATAETAETTSVEITVAQTTSQPPPKTDVLPAGKPVPTPETTPQQSLVETSSVVSSPASPTSATSQASIELSMSQPTSHTPPVTVVVPVVKPAPAAETVKTPSTVLAPTDVPSSDVPSSSPSPATPLSPIPSSNIPTTSVAPAPSSVHSASATSSPDSSSSVKVPLVSSLPDPSPTTLASSVVDASTAASSAKTEVPSSAALKPTAQLTPTTRTLQISTAEDVPEPSTTGRSSTAASIVSASTESHVSSGEHKASGKIDKAAKPIPTATSICFSCSLTSPTSTSPSPSLTAVISTIDTQTTISGTPTTVKVALTNTISLPHTTDDGIVHSTRQPTTTVIERLTTLPSSTSTGYLLTTDPTGRPTTQALTTLLPGPTLTSSSTLLLSQGQSYHTTTLTSHQTLGRRPSIQTSTFTNPDDQVVTSTYTLTLEPTTLIVTSIYGTVAPTVAPTSPNPAAQNTVVVGISKSTYLTATFLPTLLAVLVAIPLRTVYTNARLFQPFIALSSASPVTGASADSSVLLQYHGWRSVLVTSIRFRQPVVLLGYLAFGCAVVMVPLAAEGVRVFTPDDCVGACPGSLGLGEGVGRTLQVLMGVIVILLVGLGAVLWFRKAGVRQDPWSIAGLAALSTDTEMRGLLKGLDRGVDRKLEEWEMERVLERRGYMLGVSEEGRYGVGVAVPVGRSEVLLRKEKKEPKIGTKGGKMMTSAPFWLLRWQGVALTVSIFVAVVVLLLYYENSWGNNGFGKFMASQGFGARFVFAGIGVGLELVMNVFFRDVASLSPYLLMSQRPLPAARSILLSPPTNPFSGLYSAFQQRHLYLGVLSLTTLLAEFLPLTLSHVPFSILETYDTQLTCTYLSIAILILMIVVIGASLAIRWPHVPVDPRTIAGAMYYLCDSGMLDSFDGLAGVEARDRDWMVKSMGAGYMFGTIAGSSGKERVGIEAVDVGGA